MPIPLIAHSFCRYEVAALLAVLGPDLADAIRDSAPDPIECPPDWITDSQVTGTLQVLLQQWFDGLQPLPGMPTQHTPVWSNAL